MEDTVKGITANKGLVCRIYKDSKLHSKKTQFKVGRLEKTLHQKDIRIVNKYMTTSLAI